MLRYSRCSRGRNSRPCCRNFDSSKSPPSAFLFHPAFNKDGKHSYITSSSSPPSILFRAHLFDPWAGTSWPRRSSWYVRGWRFEVRGSGDRQTQRNLGKEDNGDY